MISISIYLSIHPSIYQGIGLYSFGDWLAKFGHADRLENLGQELILQSIGRFPSSEKSQLCS